jgi:hypothetical protein
VNRQPGPGRILTQLLRALAAAAVLAYLGGSTEFFADLFAPVSVAATAARSVGSRGLLQERLSLSVATLLFRSLFAGAKTFPGASLSGPWETQVARHRLSLDRDFGPRLRIGLSRHPPAAGERHHDRRRALRDPQRDDHRAEGRARAAPHARRLVRLGRLAYDGPIVVLQNRGLFSAAETFVLAMRTRPDVTFVGDSTGGGSGNPIPRELPNRWVLWVSRWQVTTPGGSWYEGIGLAPDVLESVSEQDLARARDPILERAIELLSH